MKISRLENQILVVSEITKEGFETLKRNNATILKDEKGNHTYGICWGNGKLSEKMAEFNHITDNGKMAISATIIDEAETPSEKAFKTFIKDKAVALKTLEDAEPVYLDKIEEIQTRVENFLENTRVLEAE